MSNNNFSLIIPAFNEEKIISTKLDNCLALDYDKINYEILVVDDFSTDRTYKIVQTYVKKYSNIKLIKNQYSKGKVGCVNTALETAKYEYIVITDTDVMLKKDIIKKSIKHISKKEIGAICGIQNLISNTKNKAFAFEDVYRKFYTKLRLLESKLDSAPVFHGQFMIVKKSLIDKIGVFYDDTDIAIKIRRLGYKTKYVEECIFYEKAPHSLKNLKSQKSRRSIGLILIFLDNIDIFSNIKYGIYGILIFPFEFSLYIIQPFLFFFIISVIFLLLAFNSILYGLIYFLLLSLLYLAFPFVRSYMLGNVSLVISLYTVLFNWKKSKDIYINCNWPSNR